jgi:hypothetical protein
VNPGRGIEEQDRSIAAARLSRNPGQILLHPSQGRLELAQKSAVPGDGERVAKSHLAA